MRGVVADESAKAVREERSSGPRAFSSEASGSRNEFAHSTNKAKKPDARKEQRVPK